MMLLPPSSACYAAAEGCSIAPQVVNAAVLAMAKVIAAAGAAGSLNRSAGLIEVHPT